jgi:hypothetical protein
MLEDFTLAVAHDALVSLPANSTLAQIVAWRSTIANERRICYFALTAVRSCRVTIQDLEGITHTVEVTAESLFEAVAQGLAALRRSDWVHGFHQGIVKVSVADVRVEHQVKLADFTQWLE